MAWHDSHFGRCRYAVRTRKGHPTSATCASSLRTAKHDRQHLVGRQCPNLAGPEQEPSSGNYTKESTYRRSPCVPDRAYAGKVLRRCG